MEAPPTDAVSRERFATMETRLFVIMTIGAALTTVFGAAMLAANSALLNMGWFQAKAALLVGLFAFHWRCYGWIVKLRTGVPTQDTKWLRWFNEIPTVFLLSIVLLAIVKPF